MQDRLERSCIETGRKSTMKRSRRLLLSWGLLMTVLGSTASMIHAASVTTTLPVTATVGAACTVSAIGVNFGNFTGAASGANGSVTVTCANGTGYSVALNEGAHPFNQMRHLAGPGGTLPYQLFHDLSDDWGDNCPGGGGSFPLGDCLIAIGTGIAQAHTVYGQLQGTPTAPAAGTYSDTVLVTVIF